VIPLDSDEPLDRAEDALEPDDTIKFEPYPMLPATLPAALLAGSIQEGKQHTEEVDNWLVSIRNHHVWLAAFLAGRLGNAITKVRDVIYDCAKLQ